MKTNPTMRIPHRAPRLPRDHFAMRPKLSDNAKAVWLLIAVCAAIGAAYMYLHR
jgi:hypothetical protein